MQINLTPDIENFARACIDSGRFKNVNEVVDRAMHLLREQDRKRSQFTASLHAIQVNAEQEGVCTLDEIMNGMDEIITQATQ
ncbi:MAG: type II toxin-antitoxin system ParD family antitoxin [Magnetococcales bacterium]|nr:type II toxin-antitoxin system ParD family antitoxin [Magnetococcales bacterium]